MMNAFASVAQLVELAIANWTISLSILVAFTVLFIWIFKGVKKGIKATIVALVLFAVAIVAGLAVQLIGRGITETVAFAIAWVPTVLFLLIIVISTLVGARRGFRKSMILAVQAFCAAGVCIGLYFFCISSETIDAALLTAVNSIMGGEGALQNALNVSAECETIRECLAAYIPALFGYGSEVEMILRENGAYLMTLVDLVYRLAFAIVLWLVYFLLDFFLYLIYVIAYPERKYKRKREAAFADGKADCSYHRRRTGGGIVGLVRGLVVGLITMSFIGSAFFIVAGGTGDGDLADHDFGDKNANFYYNIYRSVESYGAQGIFKVLNSVRDLDDSPYYLFAADLVFSGGLDDDLNDVHANVKFREELGAYTGFAKDTITLLMKYGEDRIDEVLTTGDSGQIMDVVVDIMKEPEFRAEFENLVDNFDSKTYVINFSLSMVGTVIAHLDDMSFASSLGKSNVELLKVMFQRGYLSETIPDERELRESLGTATTDDPFNIQPYLSINHLFDKKDAQTVLRIALSFLANEYSTAEPLELVKTILPEIEGLSILGTARKGEVNPVLGRLYCFLENTYLTEEGQDGVTYKEIKAQNISWVDELHALISVTDDLFDLYGNVKREDGDVLQTLLGVFDDENAHYEENLRLYDSVCETVADSAILGKVLASGKMTGMLREGLSGLGTDVYLPDGMLFENRYDGSGALVSRGETFQIFYGLRLLGDKENKELFDLLFDSDASVEITDLMNMLAEAVARKDGFGLTLADYLTESSVLRSVVSSVFIEQGQGILSVPYSSRERDGKGAVVNFIVKDELKQVFDRLPDLVDIITPFLDGGFETDEVLDLLDNTVLRDFLDSGNGIMEGTIAAILVKQMNGNGLVVIPRALDTALPENLDGWASDVAGRPGEVRKLLSALDELDEHLEEILNGELGDDELIDVLGDLDGTAIDTLLDSQVLHYTFSKALSEQDDGGSDGFTLIIPASATVVLEEDVMQSLIKKQELRTILSELNSFGFDSDMDAAEILRKLVENKGKLRSSNIVSASIVNYIVQNEEMKNALSLPESLERAGSRAELERYGETSVWYAELPALVNGMDELFGVTAGEENIDLTESGLTNRLSVLVKVLDDRSDVLDGQSKLDVLYASMVVKHNLTERLDEAFDGVVSTAAIQSAKGMDGYYTRSEVGALSNTVNVFDIDVFNETEDIEGKVKAKALLLNDEAEGYIGKTNLDLVYPSVITRSMIGEQLDDALLSDTAEKQVMIDEKVLGRIKGNDPYYKKEEIAALVDGVNELEIESLDALNEYEFNDLKSLKGTSVLRPDTGETRLNVLFASQVLGGVVTYKIDGGIDDGLIDSGVRSGIKDSIGIYPEEEVSSLLDAMEELGINTLDDFKGHNFVGEIKTLNAESTYMAGRTRLNVLYTSDLAGGIITKKVQGEFAKNKDLADHSKAYRNEIKIYKESEIKELVTLLGGKDISEYTLGSALEIREYVEPVGGGLVPAPRSYLVAATLTKNLLENKELVVPATQMDGESVRATELVALVDAYTALGGDGKLSGWNVSEHMVLPDAEKRDAMTESVILRATLTREIVAINSGMVMSAENVTTGKDAQDRGIAVLSKSAIMKLFEVLDVYGTDENKSLSVPRFNSVADILVYRDNLQLLCEFDAIRYQMSEVIAEYVNANGGYQTFAKEVVYVLTKGSGKAIISAAQRPDYNALTYEQIADFINGLGY